MLSIRTATVIGSGIMGSQIAAHLAGSGIPVLLLDIPSPGKQRNTIAERGREALRKAKPSPLYTSEALNLITIGNTEDDLAKAGETDWIIEAIVELARPKQELFCKLQAFMGPNTILSTNTSGIPLHILCQGLSEAIQARFVGTHFFNPPRYQRLVEVIAGPNTSLATIERVQHVLTSVLNKVAVPALDSPAFIANRIGVHAMVMTLKIAKQMNLSVEEVDFITGPMLGRPKTGTFRLADLVGLDTLGHIIEGLKAAFPGDGYLLDPVLENLIGQGFLGTKSGSGFYRKSASGKSGTQVLDLVSGTYRPEIKPNLEGLRSHWKSVAQIFATPMDIGSGAIAVSEVPAPEWTSVQQEMFSRYRVAAQRILSMTIAYAATVAPQITENLASIDEAMEHGFGWDLGPFKLFDAIGPQAFKLACSNFQIAYPPWLMESIADDWRIYAHVDGHTEIKSSPHFSPGKRQVLKPRGFRIEDLRANSKPVLTSADATLWNMGEDILLLEFHSKMNSMGAISLAMIIRSVEKANEMAKGLVIGNQGAHFCAGANIAMVLFDSINKDFTKIEFAVSQFQKASMAIKYSGVPVIVAPHQSALGGGCEFVMHSPRPVLSPETYTGLIEVGVGILPAGGGTKELTLKAMNQKHGNQRWTHLLRGFELIVKGKVSMSAKEAIDLGYLEKNAVIASNESTRLDQAKAEVLAMGAGGYRPPAPEMGIEVFGKEALACFESSIYMLQEAGFASAHDALIARGVGQIMAGGAVTAGTKVDEKYLLELEREEFLKLVGTKKTQERMDYMLKKGKSLRN